MRKFRKGSSLDLGLIIFFFCNPYSIFEMLKAFILSNCLLVSLTIWISIFIFSHTRAHFFPLPFPGGRGWHCSFSFYVLHSQREYFFHTVLKSGVCLQNPTIARSILMEFVLSWPVSCHFRKIMDLHWSERPGPMVIPPHITEEGQELPTLAWML